MAVTIERQKRVPLTLDEPTYNKLVARAASEDRFVHQQAAHLLRKALAEADGTERRAT